MPNPLTLFLNKSSKEMNLFFVQTICLWVIFITNAQAQNYEKMSYKQLTEVQYRAEQDKDLSKLRIVAKVHYDKARLEKDTFQMAKSYYYRFFNEDYTTAMSTADSLVELTKNMNYYYPAQAYLMKGYRQYNNGFYSEAFKSHISAHKHASKNNNQEQIFDAMISIAAIKNIHGFEAEALDIYLSSLDNIKNQDLSDTVKHDKYMLLLFNISLGYLRLTRLDSSRIYAKKGYAEALRIKKSDSYKNFIILNAQIDFHSGNYIKCRDSILKYIKQNDIYNNPDRLIYLGRVSDILGDSVQTRKYFKEIDSLVTISKKPIKGIKEVYQYLLIDAIKKNDTKNQLSYINKLTYFDSLLNINKHKTNNLATIGFDVPLLKREKTALAIQLNKRTNVIKTISVIGILLIIFIFFFALKYSKINKKLKKTIREEAKPITKIVSSKEPPNISLDMLKLVQYGLNKFEQEKGYLNHEVTQEKLAKKIGTNSTYLSIVINHYKGINFSSYLKDLRITDALNTLRDSPEMAKKYTIGGLASVFGFKSGDSFSRALHNKTGVNASSYIKKLSKTTDNL